MLIPFAAQIFHFMESAALEMDRPEYVTRSLIGLVGDLADGFNPPGQLKPLFSSPWIEELFKDVKTQRIYAPQTKEVARWAKEMVLAKVLTLGSQSALSPKNFWRTPITHYDNSTDFTHPYFDNTTTYTYATSFEIPFLNFHLLLKYSISKYSIFVTIFI